jgi:predicted phage terminase large subunit-like protein
MPTTLPSSEEIAQQVAELVKGVCEESLADFLRESWHVVEPSTPIVWGPHLDAICEHLEALALGDIQNLLITVPPGSTKSITCNVVFPAWVWARKPSVRWLTASNESDLAIRDAVACRRLIESPWYRSLFGNVFKMTGDQNVKGWYENDKRGFRTATTVGSSVTGKKGDILLVDDPNDAKRVESEAERLRVTDWWDKAFYNRVNDHITGRRIVIGQRTHEEDLIGHILSIGGFEHLNIPEEFEPADRNTTSIGWTDWRKHPGELLRPDRFGPKQVMEAQRRLGPRGFSAQHNQKPLPAGGDMFKREWFNQYVATVPVAAKRVRYWDKASVSEGGDYSAGVLFAKDTDGIYYLEDVVKGQWSSHTRNKVMMQVAESDYHQYGDKVSTWIEQEGGSGGKESAEISVRQLAGYRVKIERVTGSKEVRAQPLADQFEGGNVRIKRADWLREVVDEFLSFPHGKHDDVVDAASGAFNKLVLVQRKVVGAVV